MKSPYDIGTAIKTVHSAAPFGSWWVTSEQDGELELSPDKVGIILEKKMFTESYTKDTLDVVGDEDFFLYKVLIDGVVYKDLDELMFEKI
tara:strand:- start:2338 stop:2607 length:270 start_codon:yes stop_codon:yes gene_type:complete